MPIHDWSRVTPGTFHDFHVSWIAELKHAIKPLLPPEYYVMAEQLAGELGRDLLTLQIRPGARAPEGGTPGTTAVAIRPPRVRITRRSEVDRYAARQRNLIIRHTSEDRIVALVEIVSPGNKNSRDAIRTFQRKITAAIRQGIHVLVIDLHAAGPRDPLGIHGVIWSDFEDEPYTPPADKPLTLAAYTGGESRKAYVYPVAVGDPLPEMPLFLDPEEYIDVPLEGPYQQAFADVPDHLQRQLGQWA
jgi:hypothetical protein